MTADISRRGFLGGAVASATLVAAGGYSPNMANGGKGGDGIVIIRCKRIPKGVMLIVL